MSTSYGYYAVYITLNVQYLLLSDLKKDGFFFLEQNEYTDRE